MTPVKKGQSEEEDRECPNRTRLICHGSCDMKFTRCPAVNHVYGQLASCPYARFIDISQYSQALLRQPPHDASEKRSIGRMMKGSPFSVLLSFEESSESETIVINQIAYFQK
jgi:hypothetical protein